jgi:NAD(P)-dependent dehydrogenase (short-subunit alcohol dehydrogenase family)
VKNRLDILFVNVGMAKYAPLGEITADLFDSSFDVNVRAVLFTVQKALPLMSEGGAIVLNASVVGSKGLPSNSVYSATKAAVRSFARTWATHRCLQTIATNIIIAAYAPPQISFSATWLDQMDEWMGIIRFKSNYRVHISGLRRIPATRPANAIGWESACRGEGHV